MIGTLLKPEVPPMLEKLRKAAQNYPCVLCERDKMFTVAAHCNDLNVMPRIFGLTIGKGTGNKAPGYLLAYVCNFPGGCHDQIDGRTGGLSLEQKRDMWRRAFVRTMALWWAEGLIRVT